ncbi:MAG: excisionase family DNA binding protein [Bacteroidia bacterium]|jgi:excisionase family DNA binding protein
MLHETTPKISDIIRTFTAPAVATGAITQSELDNAIALLNDGGEPKRDSLITYTEAAQQLRLSTKTIKRMADSGELITKRLRAGCAKSIRVFQSSIDAILTPTSEEAA